MAHIWSLHLGVMRTTSAKNQVPHHNFCQGPKDPWCIWPMAWGVCALQQLPMVTSLAVRGVAHPRSRDSPASSSLLSLMLLQHHQSIQITHRCLDASLHELVASAHPHLQVLGDEFLFTISLTCVSKKYEESMNMSLSSAKTQTWLLYISIL
jgi:hypothetical protein